MNKSVVIEGDWFIAVFPFKHTLQIQYRKSKDYSYIDDDNQHLYINITSFKVFFKVLFSEFFVYQNKQKIFSFNQASLKLPLAVKSHWDNFKLSLIVAEDPVFLKEYQYLILDKQIPIVTKQFSQRFEYRFIIEKNLLFQKNIVKRKKNLLTIEKSKKQQVVLKVNQYYFSIASETYSNRPNKIQWKSYPMLGTKKILTLKSILDQQNGFNRLLQDLQNGEFYFSQVTTKGFYSQLQKLLNIIRVASPAEEQTILYRISQDDIIFYNDLKFVLFSESILVYLNKKEVFDFLSTIDDKLLCTLFVSSKKVIEVYQNFFSKNKFDWLRKQYQENKETISGNEVIKLLQDYWLENYASEINVPIGEYQQTDINDVEIVALSNYLQSLKQTDGNNTVVNLFSSFKVLYIDPKKIFLKINLAFLDVQIIFQYAHFKFTQQVISNVFPGIITFDLAGLVPQNIFFSGVDSNLCLHEGLAMINYESSS